MILTRFLRLKKAIESLDAHLIAKKIAHLEKYLQTQGLIFEPQNTAITQEGIFYIEPESGVATKVVAYVGDFQANLTKAQVANLDQSGYGDRESIEKFHPYHLMRCNSLTQAEKDGWPEQLRISKRTSGDFYYRVVSDTPAKDGSVQVYQEIDDQRLYICQNCMWKVSSILVGAQGAKRDSFQLQMFFDVNMMHSWNSRGLLSKDYGFTKDMYPDDWLEICRIRMMQVGFHCEACFEDLSGRVLSKYLHIHPTDHVEGMEGYVRLECLCVSCLADLPAFEHLKGIPELVQYKKELARRKPTQEEGSRYS